jgi:hypothetical protein
MIEHWSNRKMTEYYSKMDEFTIAKWRGSL